MLEARIPSLSSFFPTVKPGELALDEEGGDAAVAGLRVHVGEDDEQVGFVGVRDPELAPGEHEAVAVGHGARRQGEGVAPGAGLREGVGADGVGGQPRQVARLLVVGSPPHHRAVRRACSARRPDRPTDGSTVDSASTASTEWKKPAPAPPYCSGISMPITTQREQLVDQRARHLRLFVHLADQRANAALPRTRGRCGGTGLRPRPGR